MPEKMARSPLPSGFMNCGISWGENAFLPEFPVCNRAIAGIVNQSVKGFSELRMFFGSGYRVYFGEHDNNIVVLLCGGDKASQSKDIEQAKAFWKEYLSHEQP